MQHNPIEVELTAKSQARLLRILHELIHTYDVVHYYVSAEANQAVDQALPYFAEDEQKKVRIALLEHYGYSIRRG